MLLSLVKGTSPALRRFRCPGCNLQVVGTPWAVRAWAEDHVVACKEERAKVHSLTEDGRIAVQEESWTRDGSA